MTTNRLTMVARATVTMATKTSIAIIVVIKATVKKGNSDHGL